jgi:hypothetical protein
MKNQPSPSQVSVQTRLIEFVAPAKQKSTQNYSWLKAEIWTIGALFFSPNPGRCISLVIALQTYEYLDKQQTQGSFDSF